MITTLAIKIPGNAILKRRGSLQSIEQKDGHAASHESWRVFCAIDLPANARDRMRKHIANLRAAVPHVQASWSRENNIHLTLKFLGEIRRLRVEAMSDAANRAVDGFSPFKIYLEQSGVFPKHGSPRVLWIGVKDESGKMMELHTRLEDECSKEGFAREERAFHPHLTLARLRKPQGAGALAAAHKGLHFEATEIIVSDLLVIRSELSSAGSKYTLISRHPLGPR